MTNTPISSRADDSATFTVTYDDNTTVTTDTNGSITIETQDVYVNDNYLYGWYYPGETVTLTKDTNLYSVTSSENYIIVSSGTAYSNNLDGIIAALFLL